MLQNFSICNGEIDQEREGAWASCGSPKRRDFMSMKESVEEVVRALVDSPEEVVVREIRGTRLEILAISEGE